MKIENFFYLLFALQLLTAESSAKEAYVCKASVRARGVIIENCINWWEGNVWYETIKSGRGGGRYFIIFATKKEYQGLLDLEREVKKKWDAKQELVNAEKTKIFDANAQKIRNFVEQLVVKK